MSENSEHLITITKQINDFSTQFYKTLSNDAKNNLICSPISTAVVLSMATYGARGDTEKQLRAALHLSDDDILIKNGFQSLIDSLNNIKDVDLRLANKIFTAIGFDVKSEFIAVTETYFRSIAESLDFKKSKEASETINEWCQSNTNGHIKDVIQSDDLEEDVRLVLINAVYFKGKWAEKFDPASTYPQPFHLDENTVIEVPMMYQTGEFNSGMIPGLDAEYIEIPYESTDPKTAISMFIILPKDVNGLREVEINLHKVDFTQLQGSKHNVMLWLPKFKIESKCDLKEVLQKMGIHDMFRNTADFSGISNVPLKVSKIIQKAFIEVNEEGSEAAAVTGMQIMMMCMPPTLTVNRPFLCSIVIQETGMQLFNARIINPLKISE